MQSSRVSGDVPYLVSPVSGGAITYDRISQLFLLAYAEGLSEPSQWADFAWQVLQSQGHLLVQEGQVLKTEEENRAELLRLAQNFGEKRLRIAQALKIIME